MVTPTLARRADPQAGGPDPRSGVRARPHPAPDHLALHRGPLPPERLGQAAVTLLSLVLGTWRLTTNGLGNQYYAAAARSMTMSWRNFAFGSLDPGGYISVDKPPVAVWVSALSARVFGFSSLSLLLPSALAGAAAVAILWAAVRRTSGPVAATVAGAVLALSPINVAVNRLNLPEPFLVLALVSAAWAVVRSFEGTRPGRWLVLAGVLVGIGFNTKMLAADVVVPGLVLAIALGSRGSWWPRLRYVATFGLAAVVASLPWVLALVVVPARSRPWMGGSTNDSVTNLVFGYNGIARLAGRSHAPVHATAGTGIGGIIAGVPGPLRLFGPALGGQVGWLLPIVLVGTVAATWQARRSARALAPVALWAGWLGSYAVVFSFAHGIFHAYYTAVMVPAIAALAGLGAAAALEAWSGHRRRVVAIVVATLVATVAWQLVLTARTPGFYGWTRPVLVAVVGAGVLLASVALARARPRLASAALVVALSGTLVAPTAWAVSGLGHRSHNATLPQAGPRVGTSGLSFGSRGSDGAADLAAYLRSHRHGETWDLATDNAQQASGLIAYDHLSVMALGGFTGRDPASDVARVADLVAERRLRYLAVAPDPRSTLTGFASALARDVLHGSAPAPSPVAGSRLLVPSSPAARILDSVAEVCRPVRWPEASDRAVPRIGQIYDCRGLAPALRRSGRQWPRS